MTPLSNNIAIINHIVIIVSCARYYNIYQIINGGIQVMQHDILLKHHLVYVNDVNNVLQYGVTSIKMEDVIVSDVYKYEVNKITL